MPEWVTDWIPVLVAVIASSGFWVYVGKITAHRSAWNKMLLGLGHDRIVYLGLKYIRRGCISQDEYENLVDYLYAPYKVMNGNGSASKIIAEVNRLPIRHERYHDDIFQKEEKNGKGCDEDDE